MSADQLQVTVTGLQICSWYWFGISAFTSKGEGPRSYVGDIKTCMYIYTEVSVLPPSSCTRVSGQDKNEYSR